MKTVEQPDQTKNKNLSAKLLIGLIILGITLPCICMALIFGWLLVFTSSDGVAPFIYTLF
jgi:hypothetical protein